MKILWLGGIVLPRIAEKEGLPVTYVNGWLIQLSESIGLDERTQLVYTFDATKKMCGETDFYKYYGIQGKATYNDMGENYIEQAIDILQREKPDVIHIWGSERSHTLAMVEAAERVGMINHVVISIQGLVSIYYYHYTAFLPYQVVNGITLRDVFKGNIKKGKTRFYKQGIYEREALKKVKHVIGRTDWDRACAWSINPDLNYHFNNETLRNNFYSGQWEYELCEKHTIFCSQGHYPIKGIHLMLEAFSRVVQEFPDAHLYIGGKDYSITPWWKQSSYGRYLVNLIHELKLEDNVSFTGVLSAEEMKQRYLKSNIFISPSVIENSPNSLGEAMLLGVPCISSRVGGVHNMLTHGEEGLLYPADETYMLSYYIADMFKSVEKTKSMGQAARTHALKTHNPEKNREELLLIYQTIGKEN